MDLLPVVKWDDKFWCLAERKENDMCILWRDGKRALVPFEKIEILKVRNYDTTN